MSLMIAATQGVQRTECAYRAILPSEAKHLRRLDQGEDDESPRPLVARIVLTAQDPLWFVVALSDKLRRNEAGPASRAPLTIPCAANTAGA